MKNYFLLSSTSLVLAICLGTASCSNSPSTPSANIQNGSQPVMSQKDSGSVPASPNSEPIPSPSTETAEKIQFTCATSFNDRLKQKVPTTMAWRASDKRAIVQWVKPMDDYWTPERRCSEISQRMQAADDAGTLKYLTNGKMNGQKVICTAIEVNGACKNLLMTLRPQDKSNDFLTELKDVFNGRSHSSPQHSSREPQRYIKVDVDEMWKNARQVK
jgi:hypothetical protein